MLLRAGFTLLWNPFPHQPITQVDEITQDHQEEYEPDCEEINTKGIDSAESANASQPVTISSLTIQSSSSSETTSQDLSLDYLQGYLFKSPLTSTLLNKPIPGYEHPDLSEEPPLIYYRRREDYYPPKKVHVALEKSHPGIPGGMPVLTSDRRPKKTLFKKLKILVKKKKKKVS